MDSSGEVPEPHDSGSGVAPSKFRGNLALALAVRRDTDDLEPPPVVSLFAGWHAKECTCVFGLLASVTQRTA